jgi:hypothetical protein
VHILLTAWLLAAATAQAETAYYRVDLAPSGSLVAMGAPVARGGMILVKGYPDGKLMSLRKSDIKSITAITAQEATKPSQKAAVPIADLPMQGGSAPGFTGSPGSAGSAGPGPRPFGGATHVPGPTQAPRVITTSDGLAITSAPKPPPD